MNKVLNELVQLQELHFTLWEQQPLVPQERLADLEKSIQGLIADLPKPIARLYTRLQERHHTAVVPESNGACSACAISLPTSQTQEVRAGNDLQQCPNCKRILYHFEGAPRQLKRDLKLIGKPRDGVGRFSAQELMVPRLEAEDRDGAISELVHVMAEEGFVENPDALVAAALRREAIVSTALDRGLAFPHVRGVEGGGLTFSLGLKPEGLQFDPVDSKQSQLIFFILSPSAVSVFYLKLFSGLIETFRQESAREKLLACDTPESMWKALRALTKKTVP